MLHKLKHAMAHATALAQVESLHQLCDALCLELYMKGPILLATA